MPGPLEGIRVFDMTLAMVGPVATRHLGSLGADVIHIEAPEGVRAPSGIPPLIRGTSSNYIQHNLNKRGIILDLKSPKDKQVAYKILETCDLFVENMRTGVAERLGMGFADVSRINPRIVYVAITGYGSSGPMAHTPGSDGNIQAFGGWNSITGSPGGGWEASRHHTQMDFNAGNYITQGALIGLMARERTGKGQYIDLSMLGAAMAVQTSRIAEFFATGKTPPLMDSATITTVPHQAFLCQDKQWVAVGVTKEEQWAPFCKVLKLDHLVGDQRFKTNRDRVVNRAQLIPILEERFKTLPRYHWIMELNEVGVPAGKFMQWDEIRFHPQIIENQQIIQFPTKAWGTLYEGGPPYHFSETPATTFAAPIPGEHTDEVLSEFGLSREDLSHPRSEP